MRLVLFQPYLTCSWFEILICFTEFCDVSFKFHTNRREISPGRIWLRVGICLYHHGLDVWWDGLNFLRRNILPVMWSSHQSWRAFCGVFRKVKTEFFLCYINTIIYFRYYSTAYFCSFLFSSEYKSFNSQEEWHPTRRPFQLHILS
jgi:hypothetical protein